MQVYSGVCSLNRRHPDSAACVLCLPLQERGGLTARDIATNSKGNGLWVGMGGMLATDWSKSRRGDGFLANHTFDRGLSGQGSINFSRGYGLSLMMYSKPTAALVVNGNLCFRTSGVGLGFTSTGVVLMDYAGNTKIATGGVTPVNGRTDCIGARFISGSVGSIDIFHNGIWSKGLGGTATCSAQIPIFTSPGTGGGVTFPDNVTSDVRVFDRLMPDATFERYYTNPSAFYSTRPQRYRGVIAGGNFGSFFPFLSPAF